MRVFFKERAFFLKNGHSFLRTRVFFKERKKIATFFSDPIPVPVEFKNRKLEIKGVGANANTGRILKKLETKKKIPVPVEFKNWKLEIKGVGSNADTGRIFKIGN